MYRRGFCGSLELNLRTSQLQVMPMYVCVCSCTLFNFCESLLSMCSYSMLYVLKLLRDLSPVKCLSNQNTVIVSRYRTLLRVRIHSTDPSTMYIKCVHNNYCPASSRNSSSHVTLQTITRANPHAFSVRYTCFCIFKHLEPASYYPKYNDTHYPPYLPESTGCC